MTPTNTDLATALKEMSEREGTTLGDALILAMAAEKLREDLADTDGWIEWDAKAPNAKDGPDLPGDTRVEVQLTSRFPPRNEGIGPVNGWVWDANISHYRVLK